MPTIIKKFQYSGLLNTITIPAGATSVDMYLWGGAGAGGGMSGIFGESITPENALIIAGGGVKNSLCHENVLKISSFTRSIFENLIAISMC